MPRLSASSQDYLEAILHLSEENACVRSIDVATRLGVSRASVSRALQVLKESGFIEKDLYSEITITPSGRQTGLEVQERHLALRRFLVEVLGVEEEIAEKEACSMEHSLSIESLMLLQGFLQDYLSPS